MTTLFLTIPGNYLSKYVDQFLNHKSYDSYCITKMDKPIGFVVYTYSDNAEDDTCCIEEIFLIETSRRMGTVEGICKEFWHSHSGTCRLEVLKTNIPAVTYWEKLICKCGYAYEKLDLNEQMWTYRIKLT